MSDKDPTAYDIDFDPLQQRMYGYTNHGNHRIDVPYISEIGVNLYQGGCMSGLVLPSFINHVVSLYPWERYTAHHELASELYVRMYDSVGETYEKVDSIAEWVNARRVDGVVLVHCQAGLNRSSLVAARALMLKEEVSGDEAIYRIRRSRSTACLCNPAFEEWLRSFDAA